jgi:hypothetical protein
MLFWAFGGQQALTHDLGAQQHPAAGTANIMEEPWNLIRR